MDMQNTSAASTYDKTGHVLLLMLQEVGRAVTVPYVALRLNIAHEEVVQILSSFVTHQLVNTEVVEGQLKPGAKRAIRERLYRFTADGACQARALLRARRLVVAFANYARSHKLNLDVLDASD
ncbi:hypothetical protein [Actinocrispum wychmicini]|uniref:MarR family protein n=1 Tax=Actinocrispum wychmicini TaxID=1213861 RepID=A0A4R2IG96_9PSEU|nr:hypothetical protein [Actinocrispum wychmicini]TCO43754.1 hypothetical protein EV192_12817 [Actinocrispum wychmicini]